MHDFTVFITSYNYGHYIGNAIDSVITQTHPEWNLFILDNGSTDNTFEVIEPYLADPRIRLIKRPTNIGHTMNIALGYIELEGKFISTLQADDWLEPTFVETALKAFAKHPDIPLVAFGWMAYIEASDSFIYPHTIPYPRSFSGITALSPHLTVGNFIPQHMIAFRKQEIASIFQEMIQTPLRQLGEQFIIKRLEDRNGPSYFSAEAAGYWRRHDTQLTNINSQNYITSIENIVEPLIYNQVKDRYNSHTRFLSLTYFVSNSAKIPYRSAAEWLLSENGQHLAEQYGMDIDGNIPLYHCLACALMMAHNALASSELIDNDEIQIWITHLSEEFGIEQRKILSIANQAYGGYLFPDNIEQLVSERLGKSAVQHQTAQKGSFSNITYTQWERLRELLPEDGEIIANTLRSLQDRQPQFHLLLRLQPGSEALLADTLDSLNQACYENWHLDIITTLPAPEGLNELPCIAWHTLVDNTGTKNLADHLVAAHPSDWIIELPAGVRLDLLYLWRLAMHAQANPESQAIFVDDDCCSASGPHHSPRFKPGVNPAALQSADLAGPICVRHDAWLASGGASQANGSPWFSQLLRIADEFGWESIQHIPDVLLSYPEVFPSDPEACIIGLIESLQKKGGTSEIVPVTGRSWCIRYPLSAPPRISIAILSQGQLDLLTRCLKSIRERTSYPAYEITIVLNDTQEDPDLTLWLEKVQDESPPINIVKTTADANHAMRCNLAVKSSAEDFVLLIREEAVIVQDNWLEELVRTGLLPDVVAVSPLLIAPSTAMIWEAGNVLGLGDTVGSPYQDRAKLGEEGYLGMLKTARDVTVLSASCLLVRKAGYLDVGGMDEIGLGDNLADADLCLKIRQQHQRLIYQPLALVCYSGSETLGSRCDNTLKSQALINKARATDVFFTRWQKSALTDPFWNPNHSLANTIPKLETDYRAQWQYLPSASPRILAHPIINGQGVFRISAPLRAARKAGLVEECIWLDTGKRHPTMAEIIRLAPDSLIIQNFIHDYPLATLNAWKESHCHPFVVYALDDLITDMDASNPFRKNIPPNSRARLKYALHRCDRLVVSTDFLADAYQHFIQDIRVVPNHLEKAIWLPLQTHKRSANKPRIGWAGGSTHQGDLVLLKEVIEQTRNDADWIFFGMCPEELRPLLAEYHPLIPFDQYPARLASLNLDIAVAPLAPTAFNQGKSNLRLLEYGALGIPVVCTDIEPYQNSPACRVTNTVAAWTAALRERIADADAREREGLAMQQWVYQNYLLEDHLDVWLKAHLPN